MSGENEILLAILGDYDAAGVPSLGIEPKRLDERSAQLLDLIAKAPMRRPVAQHDVDGLALFDVGRSPTLL